MKPVLLELANVAVFRGAQRVLKNLNWTIRRGEQWAVLGPNGAGKSSLAMALCGDTHVTGDLRSPVLGDTDVTAHIAGVSFELHRAFVAQSGSYFQSRWYPGEEDATLTAGRLLRGIAGKSSARRRRIPELARQLGIEAVLERQVLHLSTGEMRRLLIARALLSDPLILVLDEPFIGLDVAARKTLSRVLSRLMREGQSLIYLSSRTDELPRGITHTLSLVPRKQSAQPIACVPEAPGGAGVPARPQTKDGQRPSHHTRRSRGPRSTPNSPLPTPAIELRDVRVLAGGKPLLAPFDWTVHPGERWALVGPNGAGKTTLLSYLTGDHPQSYAQHVRLFGHVRGGGQTLWEHKAQIGWASPDIALHHDTLTTTLDFVCAGFYDTQGLYESLTKRQLQAARRWLKFFALQRHAHKPFRWLSDGQQRLALVARALVKRPRLLILDEPCQGLDAPGRAQVLAALEHVCAEDRTTLIIVTHYQNELPPNITHRLQLKNGRARASTV